MAVFNPNPQEVQPSNYLGWSKAIEQPKGDTSMGELFKGIGDVVEQGLSDTDKVLKEYTENLGYTKAKAEQNDWLSAVQEMDRITKKDPSKSELLSTVTDETALPEAIENGENQAATLTGARDNGKIPQTLYKGRLDTLAKDLRSQFPGYRRQIDQGMERATGISPNANSYIESILGDINSRASNLRTERNKTENLLFDGIKKGYNLTGDLNDFRAGKASAAQVEQHYYEFSAQEHQFDVNLKKLQNFEGMRKFKGTLAADAMNSHAVSTVADDVNSMRTPSGEKIVDILRDKAAGKLNVTDEQMRQLEPIIVAQEMATRNRLTTKYSQKDENGESPMNLHGSEQTKQLIATAMQPFSDLKDAIHNKDYGLGEQAAIAVKASSGDTMYQAIRTWPQVKILKAFNDSGGPEFARMAWGLPIFKEIPGPDAASLKAMMMNLIGQQDLRQGGKLYTVTKALGDAGASSAPKEVIRALVDIPKFIMNPDLTLEGKRQLAAATFDPANRDLLDNIQRDSTTPDGRPIRGKAAVYQDYTSQQMAAEMHKLGDPKGWEDYKKWTEDSFAIKLFKPELDRLKEFTFAADQKLTWNTNTGEFEVRDKFGRNLLEHSTRGKGLTPDLSPSVKQSIKNINTGLVGLKNVYREDGEGRDINAPILRTLQGLGIDFKNVQVSDLIPSRLIQALIAGNRKPPEKQ